MSDDNEITGYVGLPVQHDICKDGLCVPVRVTHPTTTGESRTFDAIIERISWRTERGETALVFRGLASAGTWSGYKTFFAEQCTDAVDRRDGTAIASMPAFLLCLIYDM